MVNTPGLSCDLSTATHLSYCLKEIDKIAKKWRARFYFNLRRNKTSFLLAATTEQLLLFGGDFKRSKECNDCVTAQVEIYILSTKLFKMSIKPVAADWKLLYTLSQIRLNKPRKMVFKSKQPLKFSKFLKSKWLTDVKDHELKKRTIVVNISNTNANISGPEPRKVLPPRKSTILQGKNTAVLHKLWPTLHTNRI